MVNLAREPPILALLGEATSELLSHEMIRKMDRQIYNKGYFILSFTFRVH
jgi:hypothetical protein